MSESVEDDDNMIVLVIGDEDNSKDDQQIQVPCPVTIKIEPLDDSTGDKSGNEILEWPNNTEEETANEDYVVEFLEDNIGEENDDEAEEYVIEYLEDLLEYEQEEYDDEQDYNDYSDHKNKKTSKKTTRKNKSQKKTPKIETPKKKTHKYVSLVKKLREEYPEMVQDEQLLVEHLAGIMRQVRAPDLPKGYCTIIYDQEGQVKYECTLCGVQRDTAPFAYRHYQFKHGEFYLTCYACGVSYRNTTNLYKHEKRCRAPDAGVVLRARGHYLGRKGRGRPFTTKSRFITCNTKTAPKTKTRLFCTKCPATFVHRDNLVAHENSHAGVRPYRCHHCTMAYTSYPALKRHLKLHGDFQYICDHCGRKFQLKPALVSHLDSHRPVRKHPCLYCERRFAQKTALRHHMNKLHLNLPAAHGCPVCPKRYARLTHVKEHMDKAHGLMLITRKMYFQALPSMTDTEVINSKKFFNIVTNSNEDAEHILPDVTEKTLEQTKNNQQERYIKIIKKKPVKVDRYLVPDDIDSVSDNAIYHTVEIETNQRKTEAEISPKHTPENEKSKTKMNIPLRKKILITEPPTKIDEEIDDDLCNMEYKRQKKTKNAAPENKTIDKEMHKIVRDIKSTLTNREKAPAEKKKSTQNFYKLKREFMNQLKNEMEIPDTKEKKTEIPVEERKSPEHLVPGTEIPENLVPWTIKTENVMPEEKENTDDKATDDEKWKVFKDASEKNIVISDFLEYMKSGVVPKHVPILRRGRQTNS